jgi:hypothetical protein
LKSFEDTNTSSTASHEGGPFRVFEHQRSQNSEAISSLDGSLQASNVATSPKSDNSQPRNIIQEAFNPSGDGIVHLGPRPPFNSKSSFTSASRRTSRVLPGPPQEINARNQVDVLDDVPKSSPISHTQDESAYPDIIELGDGLVQGRDEVHRYTHRSLSTIADTPTFKLIRTSGAVQAYGVLIVVDENNEKGTLVVRQVSEVTPDLRCLLRCPPSNIIQNRMLQNSWDFRPIISFP